MFSGFTIGADSISEEVAGFFLYGFPEENSLCVLSLVFIAVHVILSVKDPILNDKNLTGQCIYDVPRASHPFW